MTNTTVQALVTKTGQFLGTGVDISGITTPWTIVLEIFAMNAGNTVRFVFEDSTNSFTTYNTDIFPGPAVSVTGQVGDAAHTPAYPDVKRYTFTQKDFPDLQFGVSSAHLRLNVTHISGGASQSVTYQSHIES